jgi:hypothetical protein
MSLLGKLDRAVYATGFDRIIFMKVQPRSFRWTPLLVLTALIVGYVVMAEAEMSHFPSAPFFLGWALFYGAYLVAAFFRIFGPRFSKERAARCEATPELVSQDRERVGRAKASINQVTNTGRSFARRSGGWQQCRPPFLLGR